MAKGRGKPFKLPKILFNKGFWEHFGAVAKNDYRDYIFDKSNPRMSNDRPFPNYSDKYKKQKATGNIKLQNQSYANSKAPLLSGNLMLDTNHSADAKNNAVYIGWTSHAYKVKHLRDMKPERILTSKAHPFPKKITRKKLMKLFNQHLKKVMPKGTRTTTIGKKK